MKVTIIGSGIVGASSAYHLSQSGVEVTIIDEDRKGQATKAGAGIICPWFSKTMDPLVTMGALYYPHLVKKLEEHGEKDISYRMVGAMAVSEKEEELQKLEERIIELKNYFPEIGEVKRFSKEESMKLFPPLSGGLQALYVSGGARVDGHLLRNALIHTAAKFGAKQVHGKAILKERSGKGIVEVENKEIESDSILIATGAWTNELLQPFSMNIPVEPQRGQIIHLTLNDSTTDEWPIIYPQESDHYIISFDSSRVVIGATRETGSGFDYRLTPKGVQEVIDEALKIAPGLEAGEISEMRIGFRPMSSDQKALFGRIEEFNNEVIVATGLGSTGLTAGPFLGKLAADLINNEELELDISPYHPFRSKAPISNH